MPRKLVSLVAAIGALAVILGAATSLVAVHSAEEIAGSQPYCIQIANGASDYRPARSWLDLSAFTMRADREGDRSMQHHAVLAVGEATRPDLYYWSYRHLAFVPGVINGQKDGQGPAVTCVPIRDFGRTNLALLYGSASESDYVRLSGQQSYLIPRIWQAKWSGGTNPTLSLATTAPDFHPLAQHRNDLAPRDLDSNGVFVDWNPNWVLSLMKAPPGGDMVAQGTDYGLSTTKTVTHGNNGQDYVAYRYIAHADGSSAANGVNTTVIDCGVPSDAFPKSCQHRFINNGRNIYFRHRPQDVADWRGMQQRIIDLMSSFEGHGRRP